MTEERAAVKADGGGLRYNEGKVRFDLVPLEWEEALAIVMTRGAVKYEQRNWERGMPWSTMVGCARRHLRSFVAGERYDPESGCHHLAAAAWNLLALLSYDLRGAGTNDLVGSKELLAAVAQAPGPELQRIIDEKAAKKANPMHTFVLTPGAGVTAVQGIMSLPLVQSPIFIGDPPPGQGTITYGPGGASEGGGGIVGSGG